MAVFSGQGIRTANSAGLETAIIVQHDELKSDVAVGKTRQLIERDKVDFVVAPCFQTS
jgi:hypothetical protein